MVQLIWGFSALCYISLPILYALSPGAFLIGAILSLGLLWPQTPRTLATQLVKFYLWALSLFGVAIGGIKLCDWSVLISLAIILLSRRALLVTRPLLRLLPFLGFIAIQSLWLVLDDNPYLGPSLLEMGRYYLAALTLLLFYQLRPQLSTVIYWLDRFIGLVALQALMMAIVQHTVGLIGERQFGVLNVLMFADPHEARISAFFSDPNKMMCFFLLTLLLRIWWTYQRDHELRWSNANWLYLGATLLSTARTALIALLLFGLFFGYDRLFRRAPLVGTTSLLVLLVAAATLIWRYSQPVMLATNHLQTAFLETFGRSRTATLDGSINTNNRVLVWQAAWPYIKQNLLWGNGLLSERNLLPIPTHNTLVQLLLDSGLLGVVTYSYAIIVPLFLHFKWWLIVALVLVPMMFLDLGNFQLVFAIVGLVMQPARIGVEQRADYCFNEELWPRVYGRD